MKLIGTHHIAIRTPNFAAMESFYTQTLGLPVTKRWDNIPAVFIDIGTTTIELFGRADSTADNTPNGGLDHLALQVANVDEAFAEVAAKEVRIRAEPRDFQDIRIAFFYDPDGNVIELVQEK